MQTFTWTILVPPVPTVAVPDVRSLTFSPAKAALEAAGLTLGTVTNQNDTLCEFIGKVMFQSPSQGANVPIGTAVNLTFGIHTGPCR